VSSKKLAQGDITFSTFKHVLGWDINTHTMTLQLPSHHLQNFSDLITPLLSQKLTSP
jgi:hypothetical protein